MIIYPAIDMKDKKCVRLTQGSYSDITVYESDPVKVARKWEEKGARILHLVDLDGARDGNRINQPVVEDILKSVSIPIQLGGGIRDTISLETFLKLGVSNVIIGTAALKNKDWTKEILKAYKERIVVSIDAYKGMIATDGWENISSIKALDLVNELEEYGLKRIVYTDIEKDGMLSGPNFDMYEELIKNSSVEIIASGGITTLDDIKKLKELDMYGAIIGKALYNGNLTLEEVLNVN